MRCVLGLMATLVLAGCAGYAADYWKPKERLIEPQLARYGVTGSQAECVERSLTQSLSVWQLRQLSNLAGRLVAGGQNSAALGPREFIYVAGLVEDPKVGMEASEALAACDATTVASAASIRSGSPLQPAPSAADRTAPAASAQPTAPAGPVAPVTPAGQPLWVNLGAAKSGQAIAVDAATVTRGPTWRQAWFRLLNSDKGAVGDIGYLLRIDCAARNITAHAGRKYAASGELIEQKDYTSPEGPMPIEGGTVIEVAYHALCDDPR